MKNEKITIEAIVNVPVGKAWQYYVEPAHITGWNFASDDWCCPRAENDLAVGGKYVARMEAKDGSFGFDFEAVYESVTDRQAFTYVMEDGRRVSTSFEDIDGATRVTTEFDAEKENSAEMQKNGWQAILNNFKAYAEKA